MRFPALGLATELGGSVVGREQEKGLVLYLRVVDRLHHLADHPVGLDHEVAIAANARLSLERLVGNDRRMRRGERNIKEEWFVPFGEGKNVLAGPFGECGRTSSTARSC